MEGLYQAAGETKRSLYESDDPLARGLEKPNQDLFPRLATGHLIRWWQLNKR
jgi:hypothetical protein